jgi:hypothetical protein
MTKGAFLTPSNVRQIKALLWKGEMRQKDIAEHYYVTQSTVSRIYRGLEWPNVKWPGGGMGEIPEDRRKLHLMVKKTRPTIATSQETKLIAAEVERQLDVQQKKTDFVSVIRGKATKKKKA